MSQFNVVGPKYEPDRDRDLFFDEDIITPLEPSDKTMAHLLARLGKFSSVSEARRNGWADVPIPNSDWLE